MSLSKDTFSDSNTNSEISIDLNVSAYPLVQQPSQQQLSVASSFPHGQIAMVNNPDGARVSKFSVGSSSRAGVEQVTTRDTQSKEGSPKVGRPIPNGLYDPNYALYGLPVDPILRQFVLNPDFRKLN